MTTINPCGCNGPTPSNTIDGTCGDDYVHISKAPGLLGALGLYEVNVNGHTQLMTKQELENTQFNLGDGNDTLVVDSNVTADIHANGGKGNDVMIGGDGDDHFNGGKGCDIIAGRGGNDCLEGGKGDDWLFGGKGKDHLDGGKGRDYLDGGPGHDTNHGGPGLDYVKFDWADLFGWP
ncbi:MAG TPA: calcium-binding protein [Albitalea sp.]|uniref:calcium-binding protein n=1 Tax=Piscinibacter sp. TaxID=1903157 RepID=UPI002ECFB9BE